MLMRFSFNYQGDLLRARQSVLSSMCLLTSFGWERICNAHCGYDQCTYGGDLLQELIHPCEFAFRLLDGSFVTAIYGDIGLTSHSVYKDERLFSSFALFMVTSKRMLIFMAPPL